MAKKIIDPAPIIKDLAEWCLKAKGLECSVLGSVIDKLKAAPRVDAVEVVRCGKCLYYSETTGKDSGKPCGYGVCTKPFHISNIVTNEDFCSFGQRIADAKMDGDGNG